MSLTTSPFPRPNRPSLSSFPTSTAPSPVPSPAPSLATSLPHGNGRSVANIHALERPSSHEDAKVEVSSPLNASHKVRGSGSHCPWSSDTVRFMTQLHEESCNLRVDIVKAATEAATLKAENAKLKDDNHRLISENHHMKQQVERMQETMNGLQNDQQRRLWNLERETHSAKNVKELSRDSSK